MNAKQISPSAPLRALSAEEQMIAENVYRECFDLKKAERVLVVTDANKYQDEAAIFYEGAKPFTDHVTLWEVEGMERNGEEPPATLTEAMKASDVVVLVSTYSFTHTIGRQAASDAGARIASLPGVTTDMMRRAFNVDYQKLAALSDRLATLITEGSTVRITAPGGTDITMSIAGRTGIPDTGDLTEKGACGNLPAGETFVAPVEKSAEGTIVFDGALADIDLDAPITVAISKGKAGTITGGAAAKEFEKQLMTLPLEASLICELGIGTNPNAILSPQVLEAEKVYGTCHIAFGRNTTFGGTIDVAYHVDGIITTPTITIDNKVIMKDGTFIE